MQNRIEKKFKILKKQGKKAFIAFITAGDPSLAVTKKLVLKFESCGVDIVELGVPFSDPMADGAVIQAASQRALKKKTNLKKILELVSQIRKSSSIPIALMSYYNPIFHFGIKQFVSKAVKCGVDGVIIPDLPPEEGKDLIAQARRNKLATIFFVSPTSSLERIKLAEKVSMGFIYYVSLTGTTGPRAKLPKEILKNLRLVKKYTTKPLCVGFGVSNRRQVKMLSKVADGVIVGSAIVKQIERNINSEGLLDKVSNFAANLAKPLKK